MLGLMLVLHDPALRFFWIVGGFLVGFWALSALRSYAASARFGYLIAITVTLWDRHATAESKVEATLWADWESSHLPATSLWLWRSLSRRSQKRAI